MDRGETIQSYNHQQSRKDESFPNSHTQDISAEDDNIDVVNDDDKDSGRHFYLFVVAKTITSQPAKSLKIIDGAGIKMHIENILALGR